MKFKITNNMIIKIILIICSFIASGYMLCTTIYPSLYQNYYLVPFLYAICLIFSRNLDFLNFKSPGLLVLIYTMIVKYLIMPITMCIGNYYSWLGTMPDSSHVNLAIILTIMEMISLTILMNILSAKEKKELVNENNNIPLVKTKLHWFVIFLGILVLIFIPETVADHRFIFNTNNLGTTINVDFQYSGLFKTIFIFARYSLVLLIINYFYKRNLKKKSKLNVIFSFVPVLLNCLYISNLSRINIFVPVLTFSIVIFLLFNSKNERKLIIRFLLIVMIGSISFMSALKFFGEGRGNENRFNDIGWWGDTLNMYFSGPKETAIGVKAENLVNETYGLQRYKLFLNDTFSNVIFFSNFTNRKNSTALYNYTYFSSNIAICQIVPNIVIGYYYLGIFLCWLWPCLFVYLCFFFDRKVRQVQTLDLKFSYLYASIYCGMVLMINSSMIISNIINVSVLFIILSTINKKIVI